MSIISIQDAILDLVYICLLTIQYFFPSNIKHCL